MHRNVTIAVRNRLEPARVRLDASALEQAEGIAMAQTVGLFQS